MPETTNFPKISRRTFTIQIGKAALAMAFPFSTLSKSLNGMKDTNTYDVIIIGGSYSGLAAAMALGRALRKVLIIDSGKPCNRQTPHSHNFLTQDGATPAQIRQIALEQVRAYDTVQICEDLVVSGIRGHQQFLLQTASGKTYSGKKLLFASGINDLMPEIMGFSECWGISVLHCPYCHGYEVRGRASGVLGNGDTGFDMAKLIAHWSGQLSLFTNGPAEFSDAQRKLLAAHQIRIDERKIKNFRQSKGMLQAIVFADDSATELDVLYTRLPFRQNCTVAVQLGCTLSEEGYIEIDAQFRTKIPGVFAAGDSVTKMRTVANAVAMGTTAGMMINKELIDEAFG